MTQGFMLATFKIPFKGLKRILSPMSPKPKSRNRKIIFFKKMKPINELYNSLWSSGINFRDFVLAQEQSNKTRGKMTHPSTNLNKQSESFKLERQFFDSLCEDQW